MTAAWMLSSTLAGLLFALAAVSLTRVVSLYRGVPLRWIWVLASAASVALSLFWLRPTAPSRDIALSREAIGAMTASRAAATAASATAAIVSQRSAPIADARRLPAIPIPHVPPSWQRTILALWALASAALLAMLLVATARLQAERRQWSWSTVADTPVLMSKTFGPAIVGVHHPAIVLPGWVLELDDEAQRAIVAHEAAHRSARDPLLLLAGLIAVVVMPWNIGLWMSWKGLRRAIELDCDARVTAHGIGAPDYARVLLGAWQRAHESWLPSTAFAERASGLGARVEHLMRPEPRGRTMRTLGGALVAAALIAVACSAPAPKASTVSLDKPYPLVFIDGVKRPDLPPRFRFVGPVVVETTTTPNYAIHVKGDREEDTVAARLYPSMDSVTYQMIDAPASVKHFGKEAQYGAVLYYTNKYRLAGGAILAPGEGSMGAKMSDSATPRDEMARRNLAVTLAGITLPPERVPAALAIIEKAGEEHRATRGPGLVRWTTFMQVERKRFASLRALLTTDADRAKLDVRMKEMLPSRELTQKDEEDAEYGNVFQRTPLSAGSETKARLIIRQALDDEMALWNKSAATYDPAPVRVKRDAALRQLVPDKDKPMFDRVAAVVNKHATKP